MLAEVLVFGFWCYVVYLGIFYGLVLIEGVKGLVRHYRIQRERKHG